MSFEKDSPFDPARVLSLALPESQWRALIEIEPEPIAWLRQQIRGRLNEAEGAGESLASNNQRACGGMA